MNFEDKVIALSKPNWNIDDIQAFLNCSRSYAVKIKNAVLEQYGSTKATADNQQKAVKADNVIEFLGGVDRLTEISIIKLCKGE